MKRICVFCGSNRGVRAEYTEAARDVGRLLASRGIALVYGGGDVGLMGDVANAALDVGGEVIGVIPRNLWEREVGHRALTQLHIVDTMHQRKQMMSDLADAFLALPGGLGTFEEIFEIWTWAQLGMHRKPLGFLDVAGYYAPLVAFLDRAVDEGFVREAHRGMAIIDRDPAAILERFAAYEPPAVTKWIDHART